MATASSDRPSPGGVVGRTRNGTVTYQSSPMAPAAAASSISTTGGDPGQGASSSSSSSSSSLPLSQAPRATATLIPEDLDGLRIVTTPTKTKQPALDYPSTGGNSRALSSSSSRKGKERDHHRFENDNEDRGDDGDDDDWQLSTGPAFVSSSTRDRDQAAADGSSSSRKGANNNNKSSSLAALSGVNLRSSKSARIKWSVLHGDGEDIGRSGGGMHGEDDYDEEGRIGLVGAAGARSSRQKIVDLEQGYGAGVGGSSVGAEAGAYPPLSEEELEEKRIQENLARFAAKDAARRRAARASKMYGPPASAAATATANGGGGFSSSGLGRKPTLGQKRGSIFGFLGLGGGYEQAKRDSQISNGSPRIVSLSTRTTSANPFESGESPTNTSFLAPSPTRETQPGIELRPTPIMRGAELAPEDAGGDLHQSSSHASLIEAPGGVVFDQPRRPRQDTYESQRMETRPSPPQEGFSHHTESQKKDRWWSALCAWGDDLDEGGADGQAGRTNPME